MVTGCKTLPIAQGHRSQAQISSPSPTWSSKITSSPHCSSTIGDQQKNIRASETWQYISHQHPTVSSSQWIKSQLDSREGKKRCGNSHLRPQTSQKSKQREPADYHFELEHRRFHPLAHDPNCSRVGVISSWSVLSLPLIRRSRNSWGLVSKISPSGQQRHSLRFWSPYLETSCNVVFQ